MDTDPYALAEELRTALASALTPRPALLYPVVAGEVVWEDCCEAGGQLAVTLTRIYPVSPTFAFPAQAVETDVCPSGFGVTLTAWVVRCWPTMDEEGEMPALETIDAAGRQLFSDARIVANVVRDQVGTWQDRYTAALAGDTLPVGPEGGCIAVSSFVTVELGPS